LNKEVLIYLGGEKTEDYENTATEHKASSVNSVTKKHSSVSVVYLSRCEYGGSQTNLILVMQTGA